MGAAQKYQGSAVLHHGSMRLMPDQSLLRQVFGDEAALGVPLPPKLQSEPSFETMIETVIDSLTQAAQNHFGIQLITEPLTPDEQKEITKGMAALNPDRDRNLPPSDPSAH
jgi:lipoate-protein ligase A